MNRKRIAATVLSSRNTGLDMVRHLFVAKLRTMHRRFSVVLVFLTGVAAAVLLTAASSPTPTPTPSATLNSGTEGSKAALVRIDLVAIAEIAHIDHSTGEVVISRGRSTVPLGSATGVLVSADGIVATTWENLMVDEGAVAAYSANELFAKVIRVPIVGNGGNPLKRGSTPNRYWAPHLQHCYHQVEHCIVFRVPQYRVHTYTAAPATVMAELLNHPSGPKDIALLRISGGGGAPTATLAAPGTAPGAHPVLVGFTGDPSPKAGPAELPVAVDITAGRVSSPQNLAGPLDAGLSGGPVLDGTTGQVVGLMGPRQPDGHGTLVPAASIQAAMKAAGVEASPSKFDAVFRRGIDHLSSGMGGSAESALEESLTYFDSALATSYLEQARKMSSEHPMGDQATAAADAGKDGPLQAALLPGFAGFLLLAGILAALVLRRGRASAARGVGGAPPHPADRASSKGAVGTPVAPLKPQTGDSQTAMTRAARADEDQVLRQQAGHGGAGPARTEAAGHESSPPSQPPASGGRGQPASGATGDVNTGPDGGETRTAGPLAPRSAERQGRTFCSQCGRSVRPGARFCSSCGYPVG
jgi:hypothetical protein